MGCLQSSFHCEPDRFRRGGDAYALDQQRAVHLHRFLADLELPRDLLVEQAARHQLEHLPLAGGQRVDDRPGARPAAEKALLGARPKIDLRAEKQFEFTLLVKQGSDHHPVAKRAPVMAIVENIDEQRARLPQCSADLLGRCRVGVLPREETAIMSDHLPFRIARKLEEGGIGDLYRVVRPAGIADHHRDRAEVDAVDQPTLSGHAHCTLANSGGGGYLLWSIFGAWPAPTRLSREGDFRWPSSLSPTFPKKCATSISPFFRPAPRAA